MPRMPSDVFRDHLMPRMWRVESRAYIWIVYAFNATMAAERVRANIGAGMLWVRPITRMEFWDHARKRFPILISDETVVTRVYRCGKCGRHFVMAAYPKWAVNQFVEISKKLSKEIVPKRCPGCAYLHLGISVLGFGDFFE